MAIEMEGILVPTNFNGMGSRYEQRTKRRKTNIILNSLIAIVIILILIVGGNIFLKDNKTEQLNKEQEKIIKQETADQKEKVNESETNKNDTPTEKEEELDEVIEKNGEEPNVEKVIIDPSWQPIGTEQTSGHQPSREMGSLDWQEKEKAAAYAVNISVENMTNWWTERGDDPDKEAILTVSEKGSSDTYRVHIEWVDGAGWKPTEVKKLIINDKK